MKKLLFILVVILFTSCFKRKPDVIINGIPYYRYTKCLESHYDYVYDYHYDYNFMTHTFDWHLGYYNKFVCDRDTIILERVPK